jgi:hypothetical protein
MKRGLTRSQAAEVLRAASLLPFVSDAFMTAVDKQLCNVRRQLTDADVSGAIVSTLNVSTSHLMCEAKEADHGCC